jgi:restriction system protein
LTNAEARVKAVLEGKPDPGFAGVQPEEAVPSTDESNQIKFNIAEWAHDTIIRQIRSRFQGHDMTRLVAAILQAEGYYTQESKPGPDAGVDILAGRGTLGLGQPTLCVQVKAWETAADVNVFRSLQGTMSSFGATQGLLVCWGGFAAPARSEARQHTFRIRLWDQNDLVNAIYRVYDRLPEEIQAELPLKQVWMLVPEDEET